MNKKGIWILKFLSMFHFGWGLALLLIAGWPIVGQVMVLKYLYMTTGKIFSNLPASMTVALMSAFPFLALGIWMIVLSRRLWSSHFRLRTTIFWTHSILFVFGLIAMLTGLQWIKAAELSSSQGGGIMSPLAWIPFLLSMPMVVLAAFSLPVAWLVLPSEKLVDKKAADNTGSLDVNDRKYLIKLLIVWGLLVCGFTILLPSIWPISEAQREEEQKEMIAARKKSDIETLREISKKPPRESRAFLQSAIMNGRLGVMSLTDKEAVLELVSSNIPEVFYCIDSLDRDRKNIVAQIEKQSGPRTIDDGRIDEAYLDVINKMNDLLSILKDVRQVPAGLEALLSQRASHKGATQTLAISLIGKLDIPADKRSWILLSYVNNGDEEAILAALNALSQMGVEAEPVVNELKRIGDEYWQNPATASLSWSVKQTAEKIEKQIKQRALEIK